MNCLFLFDVLMSICDKAYWLVTKLIFAAVVDCGTNVCSLMQYC